MSKPRQSIVDAVSERLSKTNSKPDKPKLFSEQIRDAHRVEQQRERTPIQVRVQEVLQGGGKSVTAGFLRILAPNPPARDVRDDGNHAPISELIKKGRRVP